MLARVRNVPEGTARSDSQRAALGCGSLAFPTTPVHANSISFPGVATTARRAVKNGNAILVRPLKRRVGALAYAEERQAVRGGTVGDPYDVGPNAVRHPLRPVFRWWFTRALKRQCANACAAAYVTERALQRRYPPAPHAFTTHYSSIDLPDTAFVEAPRTTVTNGSVRLILIGTLAQLYKAPMSSLMLWVPVCAKG